MMRWKLLLLIFAAAVQRRRHLTQAGLEIEESRGRKRKRDFHFSLNDHVSYMTMREFQRAYRLRFVGFMELHDAIEEKIRTGDIKQATNSREDPVDSRVRLAVTLRFLNISDHVDIDCSEFRC